MTREMLKAMLWKEWRETRWKWLAFALAFHIPLGIATLMLALRESVRFATNGARPEVAGLPGVLAVENGRHEQVLTVRAWGDETVRALAERGVASPEVLPISLEDIFVNTVRAERERRANQ